MLSQSFLLLALGACPCGHAVHRKLLIFFWSTGYAAYGAWRVLACHAAISRAVCQRLHHFVLIGEGSLRPPATDSAWRAFAELALQSLRLVTLLPCHREVVCGKIQTAGAALVGFLGESVQLGGIAHEADGVVLRAVGN